MDSATATQTGVVRASAAQASGTRMPQLPVRELGFRHVPAIPVDIGGLADTLSRLVARVKQREQPLQGLSRTFTIGASTARAYNFLFGRGASDAKAAEAHEDLRAFLSRDQSEIIRGVVGNLKVQNEEQALNSVGGGDPLTM